MGRLICTFVVRICHKTYFRMTWLRVMNPKDADRMANGMDLDQTAPLWVSTPSHSLIWVSTLSIEELGIFTVV